MILVPARQDYVNCNLHNELWWEPADYLHFKSDARCEVEHLMNIHQMDMKTAMNFLFFNEIEGIVPSNQMISPTDVPSSPSDITRRPSFPINQQHDLSLNPINFLDVHGKPSTLIHEDKPLHPLALMAV